MPTRLLGKTNVSVFSAAGAENTNIGFAENCCLLMTFMLFSRSYRY
jgi:hypothetical protein